ncbi:hypothetical protein Pint_18411 [Pistacia integerrima]|uniref:Uncharacterized protein n=1 Tax=Pistacia integerrima TaxID=434235 RepID=A0ACC0YW74_9ROSI|nr:hypothetical protein Pint_18411 [Pistacia integerrima]
MTSSENLPALTASWAFRDPWFSEVSAHETETLTKALQKTFSTSTTNFNNNSVSEAFASDFISPFVNPETPTVSNVSGSDPETSLPKRQRNGVSGPNSGKISKRKSRASKRTQTTFITADPANFRQMVQQVTGAKYGNSQGSVPSILKPEPQRLGGRLPGIGHGGGCLPTLDTSAFLLDHHQQQVAMGSGSGPTSVMGDGGSSGYDFDALSSFPTLESWKVM